uniref:Lipase maturation factor n=1 Tax=Amphimedon queenslandica TaxID=400682 RepID=A0A1X7TQG6_AMPQE
MRGDSCWRDLTCMNYHYETQPVPNPFSYYLHQSPEIIHNIETMVLRNKLKSSLRGPMILNFERMS